LTLSLVSNSLYLPTANAKRDKHDVLFAVGVEDSIELRPWYDPDAFVGLTSTDRPQKTDREYGVSVCEQAFDQMFQTSATPLPQSPFIVGPTNTPLMRVACCDLELAFTTYGQSPIAIAFTELQKWFRERFEHLYPSDGADTVEPRWIPHQWISNIYPPLNVLPLTRDSWITAEFDSADGRVPVFIRLNGPVDPVNRRVNATLYWQSTFSVKSGATLYRSIRWVPPTDDLYDIGPSDASKITPEGEHIYEFVVGEILRAS